jgi:DNA-binding SARP family transcriptional activator/Tfp pilus assembly protein PilF
VEFRVLGDLEVSAGGQPVGVGHARQRSVLAVLLLDLGRVVPPDQLIDRVWGEDPPASVRNVLYGYVARLRAAFAGTGDPDVTLTRRPGGYLLEADPEQVDLYRFHRLIAEAAAVAGDDQRAGELLRRALGLWYGRALAGLGSPWLDGMRDTLELQRITAVLDLGDIALRQGQYSTLVSELTEYAAAHPADERLIGQLMLALYRSGRQADALRWFEQTRQHLAGEFGADPGPQLRALHQRILRSDPALTVPGPSSGTAPAELPADVTMFTGRAAELAELDRLLVPSGPDAAAGPRTATAVVSAVSGTAGVGKTALALHWAHRAAGRFPDGQLYVNLRGYDPGQPVTAADALAGFLRALGVAGQDIPAQEDERATRYRSLLAGRRILVVADNAGEVEQVRSLLPGSAGCAVLVTSRDSLAGLVARDGARRLDLDLLPLPDAVGLLRALIGARADAEPAAATMLAEQCSRLPLALRVAAELAVARPDIPLAKLAGELAGRSRLDLLEAGGDPHTAVRAVFSWSCQHLDRAAEHGFRLLGLHPGPDFEIYAVAALTGSTLAQARRLLGLLARAHLIQPSGPGRYGMHDLLRAYAAEQAGTHIGAGERRSALTRLFDHYLHTAAAAMDVLFPAEASRRPRVPAAASPGPSLSGADAARAWLDAQRPTLIAVAAHATDHGWPGHATRLAVTLWRYLEIGGHYPEAIAMHSCARRAARHDGDPAAEAEALNSLGVVHWRQGRYQQATDHIQQALALFRQVGDQRGEARALANLGNVDRLQGRLAESIGLHQQALALFRQVGDRTAEARELNNLGASIAHQGRYLEAIDYLQQALALNRDIGDRVTEVYALINLGDLTMWQGRYQEAVDYLQQALALGRETGNRTTESRALGGLGEVDLRRGRYAEAMDYLQQGLTLCRDTGDRSGEAAALNALGEVFAATGEAERARAQYAAALGLARQIDERLLEARAHDGLARTCEAGGDSGQARLHWQQALALYTELGAPEADQVRAKLAVTGSPEPHQA